MIHHTDNKPELCTVCYQTFKYKKTLVRHLVNQHGVPREQLNDLVKQRVAQHKWTKWLNLIFCINKSANEIKKDKRIWHVLLSTVPSQLTFFLPSQEEFSCLQKRKPLNYECSECGKRFPSQWKLERHFVIHTGMRPFICPYCAKSHTQADNLKIHIKKIHPEEPIPSVEEMREMMSTAYHSPNLYSALTQDGTQWKD